MKGSSLIVVLLLLCLCAPLPSLAEEEKKDLGLWFEAQSAGGGRPARFMGQYDKTLAGSFGFYIFLEQESDGYREFYVGPKFKPFDWLEFGIGIGAEHVPDAWDESNSTRQNAFFSIEYEKIALYGSFENGNASGAWHVFTAIYNFSDRIGVGMMDENARGTGPRVEYHFRENMTAWGALLHDRDTGENVPVLAINFLI